MKKLDFFYECLGAAIVVGLFLSIFIPWWGAICAAVVFAVSYAIGQIQTHNEECQAKRDAYEKHREMYYRVAKSVNRLCWNDYKAIYILNEDIKQTMDDFYSGFYRKDVFKDFKFIPIDENLDVMTVEIRRHVDASVTL